jgi:hypothetical protein
MNIPPVSPYSLPMPLPSVLTRHAHAITPSSASATATSSTTGTGGLSASVGSLPMNPSIAGTSQASERLAQIRVMQHKATRAAANASTTTATAAASSSSSQSDDSNSATSANAANTMTPNRGHARQPSTDGNTANKTVTSAKKTPAKAGIVRRSNTLSTPIKPNPNPSITSANSANNGPSIATDSPKPLTPTSTNIKTTSKAGTSGSS